MVYPKPPVLALTVTARRRWLEYEVMKEGKNRVNLEEADIFVACGRGVGAPQKFRVIEELA